jgi:dephospho-CoA kinase
MLADRGAFTVDADHVVHALMGPGSELSRSIGGAFGAGVLASDGSVDRKALGAIVFADEGARARLNRLVHPVVIAEEKRLLAEAERRGVQVAVVDAALMIEAGTYRNYDCLLVVFCEKRLQIQRLMSRDGLTHREAEQRVEAQLPAEEKASFADFVIDTSGDLAGTERQVQAFWKEFVRATTVEA